MQSIRRHREGDRYDGKLLKGIRCASWNPKLVADENTDTS